MTDLSIRRYRPADAERVRELHEAAMRDAGFFDERVPDEDLDDIEWTYLDSGGEFLVGIVDGNLVAMGAFRPAEDGVDRLFDSLDRPAAVLKRMRVDPGRQRRGYGARIYDELETRARAAGYRALVLDTQPGQTAAQRFYEANGFTREGRVAVEAFGGEFELVLYRKALAND